MSFLIELRTKLRKYVASQEMWVVIIYRFLFAFVAITLMNEMLGYQQLLNHWWVAVGLALACSLIQMQGITVIIIFYGLLHLMTLSTDVALAAVTLTIVSYIVCGYFKCRNIYNIIMIPFFYQLQVPFLMPIQAGLMTGINELPIVLLGSVMSYFLYTISMNATLFLEANSEMTASILIQTKLLSNPMFYIYIFTMSVVFVAVYYIRTSKIKHAWFVAVLSGVVISFTSMLATRLFIEGREDIPTLIISSIVTLFVGVAMTFLVQGVDYNRTEKVMYEDDDYIYYVTAIPKVHVTEQDKEVKKITERKE